MENKNENYDVTANELHRHFLISQPSPYVEDYILIFLNINSSSFEEIINFCKKYHYLPPRKENMTLRDIFRLEQEEIREIVEYLQKHDGQLKSEYIDKINARMVNVKKKLVSITQMRVSKLNNNFWPETNDRDNEINKNTPYYIASAYSGPRSEQLWWHLSTLVLKKQFLITCLNCGRFFLNEKSTVNRLYCTIICGQRYRQKRYRENKKDQK